MKLLSPLSNVTIYNDNFQKVNFSRDLSGIVCKMSFLSEKTFSHWSDTLISSERLGRVAVVYHLLLPNVSLQVSFRLRMLLVVISLFWTIKIFLIPATAGWQDPLNSLLFYGSRSWASLAAITRHQSGGIWDDKDYCRQTDICIRESISGGSYDD